MHRNIFTSWNIYLTKKQYTLRNSLIMHRHIFTSWNIYLTEKQLTHRNSLSMDGNIFTNWNSLFRQRNKRGVLTLIKRGVIISDDNKKIELEQHMQMLTFMPKRPSHMITFRPDDNIYLPLEDITSSAQMIISNSQRITSPFSQMITSIPRW